MCKILKSPNNAKNTRISKRLLIIDNTQNFKLSNLGFILSPSIFFIIIIYLKDFFKSFESY